MKSASSTPPGADPPIAELYLESLPLVESILVRACIFNPDDQAELAHDVFERVIQLYPRRSRAAPVVAWVGAVAWNVARNHRARRRWKGEVLVPPEKIAGVSSRGVSPAPRSPPGELRGVA